MAKQTVLVDMDEVLVDFVSGALKVHNRCPVHFRQTRKLGVWDVTDSLEMTHKEFWDPIKRQGAYFWIMLEKLPWCDELLAALQGLDWYIVSAPQPYNACRQGKDIWITNNFGEDFDRHILTRHKHLLARKNTWLIDDSEKNCSKFVLNGGSSMLFPSLGNRLHSWANRPLHGIVEQLNYIKEL